MGSSPPLILFFVDQLRADALGAAGNPVVRTPHLDALARASVRFSQAVTNAPLCRPARFTLMTGLPVHAHGQSTNAPPADGAARPSHVRRLRDEAGYHTAVIGKTHLHGGQGHLDQHRERLFRWGFVDVLELPDPQMHQLRSAHSDWLSSTTPRGEIDKYLRWRDYAARYHWDAPPPEAEPWRLSLEDHLDSFCARAAADYLRRYAEDKPLYLQVNFPGPHPPFDAPAALQAGLDPMDPALPAPLLAPARGPVSPLQAQYARHQRVAPEEWTEANARALRVRYYAKVALVDRCVGLVLEALKEAGLYDEAWIVLTSDHGELLADHGMTGKVLSYDASLRVPLLIKPPGGVAGRVDQGTVDLLDLVATLMALGGLEPGGMGERPLHQRVLEGRQADQGKAALFETMGQVGLRTDALTMAWHLEQRRPVELYDRRLDPHELHNLVEEPSHRAELALLVEELRSRRPLPVDRFG